MDDELKEQALKAWGRVWAGNAGRVAELYRAGNYAAAKAEAERLVAEQDASESESGEI